MHWLDELALKLKGKSAEPKRVVPVKVEVVKPKRVSPGRAKVKQKRVKPGPSIDAGPSSLAVSTRIARERGLDPPPTPWIKRNTMTINDCFTWRNHAIDARAAVSRGTCDNSYNRY